MTQDGASGERGSRIAPAGIGQQNDVVVVRLQIMTNLMTRRVQPRLQRPGKAVSASPGTVDNPETAGNLHGFCKISDCVVMQRQGVDRSRNGFHPSHVTKLMAKRPKFPSNRRSSEYISYQKTG